MNIAAEKIASTNEAVIEKEPFWKEHIRRQKESKLSKMAYCRKHQLNYDHFSYWERKTRDRTQSAELLPVTLRELSKISDKQQTETLCTLAFKNGHELKIHDKGMLAMLLSVWG